MVLFAVFDSKVGVFQTPFLMRSSPEAIRSFADECGRADSILNQHPEDFSLHRLGEVDCSSGAVMPEVAPVSLVNALEIVARGELKLASGK